MADLLASLIHYEPDACQHCDVWIANDGNQSLAPLKALRKQFNAMHVFANPGHGVSERVWDRHINGTYAAWTQLRERDYEFVLKLDTDALVINPFVERIGRFFAAYPRAGLIGTHIHFPSGELRPGNFTMGQHVAQCAQPNPAPDLVPQGANKAFRKRIAATQGERVELLQAARQHGHFGSQHVQGGGYAVSAALLGELRKRQWPRSVDMFNATGIGEDVASALLCKAAGFELMDCNHPGEVFGVWFQELRLSPDELVARDYAIIHSIKDFPGQSEQDVRAWFSRRRSH